MVHIEAEAAETHVSSYGENQRLTARDDLGVLDGFHVGYDR
ncbi:hypothetical protein [Streptomyces sp. NPDC002209]